MVYGIERKVSKQQNGGNYLFVLVYLFFKQDVSLWPTKVSEVWRRSMKHRSLWIAVLIVSAFGDGACTSC